MEKVRCPKCNHEAPRRMARCLYCGEPLSAAAPGASRNCPVCKRAMSPVTAGWVMIDRCDGCLGEFYDTGELERAKQISDADSKWIRDTSLDRPAAGGPARACPGCQARMDSVLAGYDVTIEICPRCSGVWCDKGEADRLRKATIERNQVAIAPRDVVEEAEDVAWKIGLATDIMFDGVDGGERAYYRLREKYRK